MLRKPNANSSRALPNSVQVVFLGMTCRKTARVFRHDRCQKNWNWNGDENACSCMYCIQRGPSASATAACMQTLLHNSCSPPPVWDVFFLVKSSSLDAHTFTHVKHVNLELSLTPLRKRAGNRVACAQSSQIRVFFHGFYERLFLRERKHSGAKNRQEPLWTPL